MFESVLARNLPPRQIGLGAGLAIGVHAVVILAAVYLSARPAHLVEKEIRAVTVFTQRPGRIQVAPVAGGDSSSPKTRGEHRALRTTPIDIDKNKKRAEESSSSAAPAGDSSHTNAESGSGTSSPAAPGSGGEPVGTGTGGGTTIAIPFGDGMNRPSPVFQPAPVYTRDASAARSEGTVSVRCVITVDGTLKDCRIIKGVAHMDAAVLEALSRWKYTPVTFQGRPVSVYYPINLRLIAP